jgi:hypothetical protein
MPPTSGSAGGAGRHAATRSRGARPAVTGALFADWVGKPARLSGLGWGDGRVSLVLALLIVGLVAYLAVSRRDMQPDGLRSWPAVRAPGA